MKPDKSRLQIAEGRLQIENSERSKATIIATKSVISAPIFIGINSSRNQEKNWIPGQARNDKVHKTYVVMYNNPDLYLWRQLFTLSRADSRKI